MPYLLKNALIISMDKDNSCFTGNILIENHDIKEISSKPISVSHETEILDLTGKIILPGLIQGHMHTTQVLFRGLCDDLSLLDWLKERTWPLEGAHDHETNYISATLAAAELIRSGTTALIDMGAAYHQDAIFEAMTDSGLRGLFGKCMMDGGDGVPSSCLESTAESLMETERLINSWHNTANGRIQYAVAPRFVPTCSRELLENARDLARGYGLRLHTHASENLGEIELVEKTFGMRNIHYLNHLGYTGEDVILAHCIWLDDDEKNILADTGTNIVHCPSSNTKMSSGIAPIVELQKLGANISIGLDGAHNHVDSLMEVRQASILQKARLNDPLALPALEALKIATLGGAKALGQEDKLGSLEVGKRADLIVLDPDMLHSLPAVNRDPIQRVVYECTRENITHTMVDGKFLYKDRQFTTIDLQELMVDMEDACTKVIKRSGIFLN